MTTVKETLGDKLTRIATRQLIVSSDFKRPRLERVREYENLYAGKLRKKLRSQFNVPLPVFSGMIDTLMADLDEDISLTFTETDPSDYKATKKIQASWDKEISSSNPSLRFNQKIRWARRDVIFCGRAITEIYAESDPYKTNFDNISYIDFHCEPKGGGYLEHHLFTGREGIYRSKSQIESLKGTIYDRNQVDLLFKKSEGSEYKEINNALVSRADIQARFNALNLNAEINNYVGEKLFSLVEWILNYEGKRWYIVYEPFYGIWLRVDKLSDVFSNNLYPYSSWASHENDKLFWSKSFADDLYPVADSIITLFNQELTNRQKRNLNARYYDKDMFKDVAKLDEAQWRPDALVPVDTKGGTRRISDGIYQFETPELTGTINIIDWIKSTTGEEVGVNDIQKGASQPTTKPVRVTYAELGQISKRLSYMSQPFLEFSQDVGVRYIGGLKDYLKEPMSIRLLGLNGYEWDSLKRVDLSLKSDIGVSVLSQSQSNKTNEVRKNSKVEALKLIANSQNVNARWRDEQILKDVGGYSDEEVAIALDVSSDYSKELQAEASIAIQGMIKGKTQPLNYGADTRYLQNIMDFAVNHRDTLKDKYDMFLEYVQRHLEIARENMMRKKNLQMSIAGNPNEENPMQQNQTGAGNPVTKIPQENTSTLPSVSEIANPMPQ